MIPIEWDESADVIVIGSGLAGLAAAIEARNLVQPLLSLRK